MVTAEMIAALNSAAYTLSLCNMTLGWDVDNTYMVRNEGAVPNVYAAMQGVLTHMVGEAYGHDRARGIMDVWVSMGYGESVVSAHAAYVDRQESEMTNLLFALFDERN